MVLEVHDQVTGLLGYPRAYAYLGEFPGGCSRALCRYRDEELMGHRIDYTTTPAAR